MSKKFLVTFVALMALLTLTATGQGWESRHCQRVESDGRRRTELDSLLWRRPKRQSRAEQQLQPAVADGRRQRLRARDRLHAAGVARDRQTFAAPVTGGAAAQTPGQQNITPQNRRGRSSWRSGSRRGDS